MGNGNWDDDDEDEDMNHESWPATDRQLRKLDGRAA